MPACGDCAKLFLPWIWNGFVHTSLFQDCLFLSISNKPFKWINSNPAITLAYVPYIYGNTIPRNTTISFKKNPKTHFTHSKSNQIIYECWMTIEWCWKTLTRKDFLVSEYFVILYFRFLLSIWKFKNVIDCMFKFLVKSFEHLFCSMYIW